MSTALPATADAVVVGAGMVGAACAHHLADEGLRVLVLDRGSVAGGTTGRGEGNILVSDKEPGPALGLALLSYRLWQILASVLGPACELQAKGGLVVADTGAELSALTDLARLQGAAGVTVRELDARELPAYEPALARDLVGGVSYPQDLQVQPALAATLLLHLPRGIGAVEVVRGCAVRAVERRAGRAVGVLTSRGRVSAPVVVNAAGPWGGELARSFGAPVPVVPRRGVVLVTGPLQPGLIRHKVYTASYVADVASAEAGPRVSTVVEGTPAGTVLIGASRERVGFRDDVGVRLPARLAARAVRVFPVLSGAWALRSYAGFRPYTPDHLPVIGPDPRLPGLFHAVGHEGAGIGLAPATGALIAAAVTGRVPPLPPEPYLPARFGADRAA